MFLTKIAVLLMLSLRRLSVLLIWLSMHWVFSNGPIWNKIVQIIKLVNCTVKIHYKIADEVQMFKKRFELYFYPPQWQKKKEGLKKSIDRRSCERHVLKLFVTLCLSLFLWEGGNPILGFLFVFRKSFVKIKWPIVWYLDSIKVSILLDHVHTTFSSIVYFVGNKIFEFWLSLQT